MRFSRFFDRKKEILALPKSLGDLMNEVEELRLRVVQLEKENAELRKLCLRITQLEEENAELKKKLLELENKFLAYENAHTPPSKQRFPPKREGERSGKIGRPPGAEGSTRPTPKPDETVEVKRDFCPSCRKPLGKPNFFESKIVEEIPEPQPVKVTEYKLAHYFCSCGEHVVAEHPECPKQGRFGPNLQAEVVLMRTEERLPLRKIKQVLSRRYGLQITPATVLEIENRVKGALLSQYEKLKAKIRNSDVVYCDETTFRVGGKDWWLWVFRTTTETLLVLRKSRSGEVAREILGNDFDGVVVSDGYSVYCKIGIQQRCWAHLIRELKFAVEKYPHLNCFLEELREFYHDLKKRVAALPPPLERREIFQKAEEWLEVFLNTVRGWRELRRFRIYMENGMPHWLTFIEHEEVESTNNLAERALREQIVFRKIIGTLRNEKGAGIYEALASLVATWTTQGANPREMLVAAVKS